MKHAHLSSHLAALGVAIQLLLISAPVAGAYSVTAFDATVWPRTDAALGVSNHLVEDFEDEFLLPGVFIELTDCGDNIATTNRLPLAFHPATHDPNGAQLFAGGIWDGQRALVNRRSPLPIGYVDGNWGDLTFHFPAGAASVGFSVHQNENAATIRINGSAFGSLASYLATGAGRNGYVRIDAGPGEVIYSVTIANEGGDGIAFDHLAFRPAQCAPLPADALAWWPAEGNALDRLGTNAGTLHSVSFAPGWIGQSFFFNGTSAYVDIPSSPTVKPTGPFTVEAWVNYDQLTGASGNSIFAKGVDAESPIDWGLVISGGGRLRPHADLGGTWVNFDCTTPLATGVWYHVAMVFDGASLRGYVNGVLDGTTPVAGALKATDQPLRIGAYAPVNGSFSKAFFAGRIDEPSLYGRALSAEEIAATYAAGAAGKCGPLSFDPTLEFTVTNGNPNGVWSYGWMPTDFSQFNQFTNYRSAPNNPLWHGWGGDFTPGIWKNLGGLQDGVPPGLLSLHPGNGNQPCILRWTAPGAGTVNVTGRFLAGDIGTMLVAVRFRNQPWWNAVDAGTFSLGTNVLAGDTVDFAVYGGYGFGNTPLEAQITLAATGECSSPPSGLISWWSGDGTTADLAGSNEGVLVGDAGYAPGKIGSGFNVDGSWDYVLVENSNLQLGTNDFTVTGWLKTTSSKSYNAAVSWGNYNPAVYVRGDQGGVLELYGSSAVSTVGGFNDGEFHHFAVVRSNGVAFYYQDGTFGGTANYATSLEATDFRIGYDNYAGDEFPGVLDEILVFGRALSAAEIAGVVTNGGSWCRITESPFIIAQPQTRTNAPGSTATFTVSASGTSPLSYQWFFNTTPLTNNARITGAQSSVLSIASIAASDAGAYSVVITNSLGSTNSLPAQLVFDGTPPAVNNLLATPSQIAAEIAWETSEPATARVDYGLTSSYGSANQYNGPLRTNHSFTLLNLTPGVTYHYRVRSSDAVGNETVTADATFTTLAAADLVARILSVPTVAQAGQPATMIIAVTNLGPAAATGAWENWALVSPNSDGSGFTYLSGFSQTPPGDSLAPGASQILTQAVTLPALQAGTRYLGVVLDYYNQVVEVNDGNNQAFASTSTFVQATDLRVVSVSAPPSAQFGATINVQFVITNAGNATAPFAWNDRLALSATENWPYDTLLATVTSPVANLPAGARYTNTVAVTLPLSTQTTPGNYFVVVAADYGNDVAEVDESNNLRSAPLTLTLPPLPDLAVASVLAPANATPGQMVELRWTTTNRGNLAVSGVWSETIYLATNDQGEELAELATLNFTNSLNIGSSITRTQSVALPLTGPAGNLHFTVQTDSRGDVTEQNETNNLTAASATVIPAVLSLRSGVAQISEGASQAAIVTVTRNGSRAQPLTVALVNGDATELSFTNEVTIPAGLASTTFPALALADGIVDGPQPVPITASAAGFTSGQLQITVLDTDLPTLTIHTPTNSVAEGQQLMATVRRDAGTNNTVLVTITSSSTTQLLPPAPVTLPAGATAANFPLLALDDSLIESAATYTVTASASGHHAGSTNLTVLDDDLPVITLSFAPDTVRESGGPQASLATITRTPVSPRSVELDLESSNTNAALVPATLTIPAAQSSVTFPVAVKDNAVVDGAKTVTVRSWVKTSAFGARLAENPPAQLTVTDDDGPTLQLVIDKDLVAEGLNPAAIATVSRNTATNTSLLVNLASSDTTEITVPPSVTIPAGAASVTFHLVSVADGATDGNQVATVTASAAGFTSGTDQITVSDVNLPDLVIASVSAPASAVTEAFVTLGYELRNQGLALAPSNAITQRVYLSGDPVVGGDTLISQIAFTGPLPPNTQIGQTFQARLPQAPGDYWVIVEADVLNTTTEVIENNNVSLSPLPIHVGTEYEAEVSTTLNVAPADTPVPLTGRAFRPGNVPMPNVLVSIHIYVKDTHRVIAALTDGGGNFATTWQPLPGEAGTFQIGAAHPGVAEPPGQDSFVLLGLKAQPAAPFVQLTEQSSVAGFVTLENSSEASLTGLMAEVISKPANLDVLLTLETNQLGGLLSTKLNFGISAMNATIIQGTVLTRVTTAQGITVDVPITVRVDALRPKLVAFPGRLDQGMKRGLQRLVQFDVVNTGGANSGPITVSLPPVPWMSLVSANPLPDLPPGQTNKVTLALMPPADLELTVYQGNLAMNGVGTGLSVPYSFRALSEARGDLKITAVDEFTYFAVGSPPLTNALVTVRDTLTGAIVTNGVTDAAGEFFAAQLLEGYYDLEVSADRHSTYVGTQFVDPGVTNNILTFLSRQTVRYTWSVERIEIEDRYEITIETEFEANVPAPVVTITPPMIDVADMLIVGQVKQINLTVQNHGLIAVENTRLQFGSHPFYEIVPLIGEVGLLGAKSSLTIPVTVRRIGDFTTIGGRPDGEGKVSAAAGVACGMSGGLTFQFECGPLSVGGSTPVAVSGVQGDCRSGPHLGVRGFIVPTGTGGDVIGEPGTGGPGVVADGGSVSIGIKIGCDPTCLALAVLGCVPGPTGCFFGGVSCGKGLAEDGVSAIDVVDCAVGAAGCLFPPASVPACIYSITRCFVSPARPDGVSAAGEVSAASDSDDVIEAFKPGVRAMMDSFNEVSGAPDGIWLNPSADSATGDWFARFLEAAASTSDDGRSITPAERTALLDGVQPPGVPVSEVMRFLDRWNRSLENYALGIFRPADAPPGANLDFIDSEALRQRLIMAGEYQEQAELAGFTDPINAIVETVRFREEAGEDGGVCARVRIRLDQEATVSREAFRATLEIDNGDATPLQNIAVIVRVTDGAGNDATSLFGLRPPELTGLSDVNGGGSVAVNAKGTARWTIIPSVDAAPVEPVQYFVSGEFRYVLDGVQVTIPLAPVPITVHPTPILVLNYFHQRDVYSDDPHTDVIEPSIPFNLAVMVQNKGHGEARNFRIASAQPEIIENEKGLLIDFKIIATEVAGQNLTPSLTANFGTIDPGETSVARWLLTSTLQGLFIDYEATFEHIDGLGNPRLSLIESVDIHEMIRLVQAGGAFEDGKPDFLVNDQPDLRDLPDTLWLSDGTTNAVEVVTNGTIVGTLSAGNLQVTLNAALPAGWAYLRIPDPGDGDFRLVSVTRSDNAPLPAANAWVTDRTFQGQGKRPKNEFILHLLDYHSTGSYTLNYEEVDATDTEPPASQVAALPTQSQTVIPLSWSGSDNAGAVASFDIYVSENDGPFQRWLWATHTTSSVYQGNFGSSYAFYSVAVDAAGNREAAPSSADAQTSVAFTNGAPMLMALTNVTIPEGQTLTLDVIASDPDDDDLTFSLAAGAPPGMTINSSSGRINWATGEGHGPSTNTITVQVLDSGIPQLLATRSFVVVVQEVNSAPALDVIANRAVNEGAVLSITNFASDLDLPPQKLTFSLGANAPAGAAVNATNGIFTWKPGDTQGGTTNTIAIIVTDNGPGTLNATQTFTVIVRDTRPDFTLALGTTALRSGNTGGIPLTLQSGVDLTSLELLLTVSGNRLTNFNLSGLAPEVGSANFNALGSNRFNVRFDSRSDTLLQGNLALAQLGFATVSNEHSAVVVLRGETLTGTRASLPGSLSGKPGTGRVFIIAREPILDAAEASNNRLALTLYGVPGERYAIERRNALNPASAWAFDSFVEQSSLVSLLPLRPASAPSEFFRALQVAGGVEITIRVQGNSVILEWPLDCDNCELEEASQLTPGAIWTKRTEVPQEVNGRYQLVLPIGINPKFYRLLVPPQ